MGYLHRWLFRGYAICLEMTLCPSVLLALMAYQVMPVLKNKTDSCLVCAYLYMHVYIQCKLCAHCVLLVVTVSVAMVLNTSQLFGEYVGLSCCISLRMWGRHLHVHVPPACTDCRHTCTLTVRMCDVWQVWTLIFAMYVCTVYVCKVEASLVNLRTYIV